MRTSRNFVMSVFFGLALGIISGTATEAREEALASRESAIISGTVNPGAADARVIIPKERVLKEKDKKAAELKEPSSAHKEAQNESANSQSYSKSKSGKPSSVVSSSRQITKTEALREMYTDMKNGINTRQVNSIYQQWRQYAASVLSRTNAEYTGSEITNVNRLGWYKHLYLDPIPSVMEMENYTRYMYYRLSGSTSELLDGVHDIRRKMDLPLSKGKVEVPQIKTPQEAINFLVSSINKAYANYKKAIAPLSEPEIGIIASESNIIFSSQTSYGHTLPNIGRAKYLIELMNKTNRGAMYDAAEALLPVFDPLILNQLRGVQANMYESYNYHGSVVLRIPTDAGDILVGGVKNNVWDLDKIDHIACIIDLGGNDTYIEGSCNPSRPIFLTIDLGEGNDKYIGEKPGIQGGAILGVSICYNEKGNNSYDARYLAQGSTIGGVGILFGGTGKDRYKCFMRGQGTALCGLGMMIERGGDDDYHSALFAQGFGHPGGFGVLADIDGKDHYYVGGHFLDSYPEHPGYDGWGQGIGAGIRGGTSGGIGLLFDGGGDDVYEYDYFAHGGGYWLGIGAARDFAGNDKRIGATRLAYDGGPRTEAPWQRFCNGFGCHYAVGYCFDDQGNDFYDGTIMGLGMAWDLSAGFLVDFQGNDIYAATGGLTQGTGAEGSIGMLFDYRGNDTYTGYNQGYASPSVTYHNPYDCGGNLSFVVDHGGKDEYGSGAQNDFLSQRGTAGGFIIDRPTQQEVAEAQKIKAQEEIARKKAEAEAIAKGETPQPQTTPVANVQQQQQQQQQYYNNYYNNNNNNNNNRRRGWR